MPATRLLHVGYIKTGSTWLQRNVFRRTELGFHAPGDASRSMLAHHLYSDDGFSFDPNRARSAFVEAEKNDGHTTPVWSEEVLLGDPLVRRYDGGQTATRLHAAFENAHILIVVREQNAMATSMYKEYIAQGNAHTIKDFVGSGHETFGFQPILRPQFLAYSSAVRAYQSLFGKDRVLVLPYELLREDYIAFTTAIFEFVGRSAPAPEQINASRALASVSTFGLNAQRVMNRFAVRSPLSSDMSAMGKIARKTARVVDRVAPKGQQQKADAALKDKVTKAFGDRFARDNRDLQSITGLDLQKYGYKL